jgi:hypothetical protein
LFTVFSKFVKLLDSFSFGEAAHIFYLFDAGNEQPIFLMQYHVAIIVVPTESVIITLTLSNFVIVR